MALQPRPPGSPALTLVKSLRASSDAGGLTLRRTAPLHPADPLDARRVAFGRAPVDCVTMPQATSWLLRVLESPRAAGTSPHLVMGPNAFLVTLAQREPRFAQALAQASLCLPDGMSVVWGGRLLGHPVPERVTGGDFLEQMCALCAETGKSVYFLGGLPGAAAIAARILSLRYPGLIVAGTDCPMMGFEQDPAANDAVLARIRAARPDLLCVALGAPKQEIWMLDHCARLPIGAALSVGAAFDTQAGLRRRAPRWTHSLGVEWLYRLALEPTRLWRRYLIGNAQFGSVLVQEWIKQRKARATARLLQPVSFEGRREVPGPRSLSIEEAEAGLRGRRGIAGSEP